MIPSVTAESTPRLPTLFERWGLFIVVGGLLGVLWVLVVWYSAIQRDRWIDSSRRELAQLNSAVAEHTAGMFRSVQTALRAMDLWLKANPRIDPRRDAQFIALVDELRKASEGMFDLRMVSSDGKLYYVPAAGGTAPTDVSDRSYYKVHLGPAPAAAERRLYIGDPVLSRVTKKWGIPISWRLESTQAGFRVVFAAVELERLSALHDEMRLKPSGTISLVRTDGVVLNRTPYLQSFIGANVRDSANFKNEYGLQQRGTFLTDGAVSDRVPRLISFERLQNYPVVVLVTEAQEDILAPYHERRNTALMIAAGVSLVVLLFTFVLNRTLVARRTAERQMRSLAMTDSLTGAMSRHAFVDALEREFHRARRYQRPLAVLAIDLDHFKSVNDRYGHAVGDAVLRGCAEAAQRPLRAEDRLGRIGGEEFCVYLPETSMQGALQVAERVRNAIAAHRSSTAAGDIGVTASIGVAGMLGEEDRAARVLRRADRALYLAKERGRDRVEAYDESAGAFSG